MLEPGEDTLAATLESLDGATNYRDWIFGLARPHLEPPVLEVGAGTGTFTGLFAEVGSVTAVEPVSSLAALIGETHGGDSQVELVEGGLDDVPAVPQYRSAAMFNVLEHIPDDRGVLLGLRDRLLPGATLVLFVPAFPFLYSRFDVRLGHCRRYRRRELRALLIDAGYDVVDARYVNLVGWFAWLLVARVFRQIPNWSGPVSLYDRWAVPVLRAFEAHLRAPFGQSLLVVARKPLVAH